MARLCLFHSCALSLRQVKPISKLQPFKYAYSTQSAPINGEIRRSRGKYVALGLTVVGGFTIVAATVIGRQSSNISECTSAEDPEAPAWSTFTLQARQSVSPTAAIFTFKSTEPVLPSAYYDKIFQSSIFAVDIAQPQLQIVREYTPLPPALDPSTGKQLVENDCAELHLLIRKEPRGEVSSYVHALSEGAEVRISKPRAQVSLKDTGEDRDVNSIVMIVGGTGITAALQAVHALLEAPGLKRDQANGANVETRPHVHIMWANRRREDCLGGISDSPVASSSWWSLGTLFGGSVVSKVPETELGTSPIVDEIRWLKARHGERLKVDYYVDEEDTFVSSRSVQQALASTPDGKAYIAVSGPEGFMNNFAGEKRVLKNRITERPSTGVLAGLGQKEWKLMVLS